MKPTQSPQVDSAALSHLLNVFATTSSPPIIVLDLSAPVTDAPIHGRRRAIINGSWDCFGAAHVELLQRARSALPGNSSLFVGVLADHDVLEETGERPLLAMLERALAVAQCRHVDGVVLNTRKSLDENDLRKLQVQTVVLTRNDAPALLILGIDGISVEAPALQTVPQVCTRVQQQLAEFEARQRRKGAL